MKILLFILSSQLLWASKLIIPHTTQQLLVVTLDTPTQKYAKLKTYERDANHPLQWREKFHPIDVVLGRHGIGKGLGLGDHLMTNSSLNSKIEGDGKSPAGLFRLSKLFGYQTHSPNTKMPYIPLTKDLHCVDDSNSSHYNQIISKQQGYKSFEVMHRDDNLYKWGIVVEHNRQNLPYKGSCIFIHVARADMNPTAGCTAMREKDLLKIIKWLDQNKHPALLQGLKSSKEGVAVDF